jgi:hypothetical protein
MIKDLDNSVWKMVRSGIAMGELNTADFEEWEKAYDKHHADRAKYVDELSKLCKDINNKLRKDPGDGEGA